MAKKKTRCIMLDEIKLFDEEEENLDFPSICKFIRKVFNATQEQMAQKLNVTTSAYVYWESGKYVPKGWQAINLGFLYLHAKNQVQTNNQIFPKEQTLEQDSQNSQQNAA